MNPKDCAYYDTAARHAALAVAELKFDDRKRLEDRIMRMLCDAWETGYHEGYDAGKRVAK